MRFIGKLLGLDRIEALLRELLTAVRERSSSKRESDPTASAKAADRSTKALVQIQLADVDARRGEMTAHGSPVTQQGTDTAGLMADKLRESS